MITFFRRIFSSRFGTIGALAFLVMIGFAFALSDVTGSMGNASTVSTGNVASAGGRQISTVEVRQRIQRAFQAAQQQQPGLTMEQFLADDRLETIVREMAEISSLEQFARAHGIGIDAESIDALINSNPAFAGPDGSFSQQVFEAELTNQGLTARRLREELQSQFIVRQLVAPVGQIAGVPRSVTLPYASLLLERRQGQAVFVPASRFAPTAAPTDQQLATYYRGQRARYTLPERRALRYAIVDDSSLGTLAPVTPPEIQAEYTANAAEYAARETRQITQVIAGTRELANRIATAVRGGQSLTAAASAAGLSASSATAQNREQFGASTNVAAANAVFTATRGAVVGPIQVPLGWIVIRIDNITGTPARSLAQVTPELTERLTLRRRQEAMVDLYNGIQDSLNGGASVTDVAGERRLQLVTTPALQANGTAPDQPGFALDPRLRPIIAAAFQAHEGDAAQAVTIEENRVFAIVEVARTTAAAPPPIASVRDRVVADWRQAEGARAARDRARTILAAVEDGQTLSAAATAAGTPASVQNIGGIRINLSSSPQGVPPEIALLFSMARGTAKTLELPGNSGWMVIQLNSVIRGDASDNAELQQGVASQFGQALGSEYVGILIAAARAEFPISIDEQAVQELRNQLVGGAASPN